MEPDSQPSCGPGPALLVLARSNEPPEVRAKVKAAILAPTLDAKALWALAAADHVSDDYVIRIARALADAEPTLLATAPAEASAGAKWTDVDIDVTTDA
ncbi:uncharacterized protein AMSG_11590 [Thecamonas trahens ATCC 50062]|uniref:Uncharacterized protein n=1 Tax=Thecamonas trahens ATCC 50062 TaxID=461836 RepID=A0A0L0D0M1_THETB|nr:hypothetical protein AMSG_11590 [Thecamonas trahens ATCC 50062]KNC45924.1 hypothetical protein AMSG_11590 [Thecamonas trahens ATCC 50062]|eukprot:XP_013763188.1 hypothetical protein AMSG_11590 [Thecamonas trahens ATCC 50062]